MSTTNNAASAVSSAPGYLIEQATLDEMLKNIKNLCNINGIKDFNPPAVSYTNPTVPVITIPFVRDDGSTGNISFPLTIPSPASFVTSIDVTLGGTATAPTLGVTLVYTDDNGAVTTVQDTTPVTISDWTPNNVWHDTDDGQERFYFAADGTTYYRSGDDHQFRNDSNQNTFHISKDGYVGVGGVTAPKTHMHFSNTVSNASDGFATTPVANGFDAYTEFKALFYDGGTPQNSYGMGVENTALAYNSRANHIWRSQGRPIFGVRGDGWMRVHDYGAGIKDAGTPVSALLPSSEGWIRERGISAGARLLQTGYGGNWMFGVWSPVHTADTAILEHGGGWETAFSWTAPTLSTGYTGTFDCRIDANFGRMIHYIREVRIRSLFGWRVLVNGVNVGTRDSNFSGGDYYFDVRTNLGNETNIQYIYEQGPEMHWVRNSVPAGASVQLQFRHRYQVQGAQTNAYARTLVGYGREANVSFLPNKCIVIN